MQAKNNIVRDDSPNQSQLKAIQTAECPLLIVAGPGSGKTNTLVERAFYLIAEKNVPPESIFISMFTEKATREIIDCKSETKPDVSDVQSYQRYQKQLETYAHIVEERHGLNVSQMHLYYTVEGNSNPLITFDKNQRHIDQTMQEFDGIVNRIENRDFQISQQPKRVCKNCDLRFYCAKME